MLYGLEVDPDADPPEPLLRWYAYPFSVTPWGYGWGVACGSVSKVRRFQGELVISEAASVEAVCTGLTICFTSLGIGVHLLASLRESSKLL